MIGIFNALRLIIIGLIIFVSLIALFFIIEHYVFNPQMKGISHRDIKDLGIYFYAPTITLLIISSLIIKKLKK